MRELGTHSTNAECHERRGSPPIHDSVVVRY